MNRKMKVIAYYLPQFHTIPENDEWWGKGFTEWVNVKKAKPLYRGHKQPNVPAPELGYYNLLDDNIRRKQSELAKEAGIDGFCYWHYWFGGGKELLEKPFRKTLADKQNDFGFCLGWANESWKAKQWTKDGRGDVVLIEQKYPGREDYINHFNAYIDAFKDSRYIRVEGRPVFLIYKPIQFDDLASFTSLWNGLAEKNGLGGFCFVGCYDEKKDIPVLKERGLNYIVGSRIGIGQYPMHIRLWYSIKNLILKRPSRVIDYKRTIKWAYTKEDKRLGLLPTVFPNWDHSPRSGMKCTALHNSTPELFGEQVKQVLKVSNGDAPLLFVKSWNEWGEGNFMEPDSVYGHGYIQEMRKALDEFGKKE